MMIHDNGSYLNNTVNNISIGGDCFNCMQQVVVVNVKCSGPILRKKMNF